MHCMNRDLLLPPNVGSRSPGAKLQWGTAKFAGHGDSPRRHCQGLGTAMALKLYGHVALDPISTNFCPNSEHYKPPNLWESVA
jgi:hypothetical protein